MPNFAETYLEAASHSPSLSERLRQKVSSGIGAVNNSIKEQHESGGLRPEFNLLGGKLICVFRTPDQEGEAAITPSSSCRVIAKIQEVEDGADVTIHDKKPKVFRVRSQEDLNQAHQKIAPLVQMASNAVNQSPQDPLPQVGATMKAAM